jgi:RNA 3'-terminal phosphate cyclase
MIELDGAAGEGGGQILRSALALSMVTGQPFRIGDIRARRTKPGLLRQHLVAVQAAAEVSGASVTGAELGSTELSFTPGPIRGWRLPFRDRQCRQLYAGLADARAATAPCTAALDRPHQRRYP